MEPNKAHATQIFGISVAAFVAALAIVILSLALLRYVSQSGSNAGTTGQNSLSDQQKMQILAQLSSSSSGTSTSDAQKAKTLKSLKSSGPQPTEAEKAAILQGLQH